MELFKANGVKLIEKTIGNFEKITEKLCKGIELCLAEVEKHKAEVSEKQLKITDLNNSIEKAKKVAQNISNLLGS